MPQLAEIVFEKTFEPGLRFHKGSGQFISQVGYHEVVQQAADGTTKSKRIRTTQYYGGLKNRNAHFAAFEKVKADWEATVAEQRKTYDAEQQSRRSAGLPPLGRFLPTWQARIVVRPALASRAPVATVQPPVAAPLANTPLVYTGITAAEAEEDRRRLNPYQSGEMFITRRRERTKHQNRFTTTTYIWPETQRLMEKFRAPLANPFGSYFLSQIGTPFSEKTVAWDIDKVKRDLKLRGKISMKQFRKIGASQIMALADSDAMHQYKANAFNAADAPYIDRDFTRLTNALKKFREKLLNDNVLT